MNRIAAALALLSAGPLTAQVAEAHVLRFPWQAGQTWFEQVTQTWTRQDYRKGKPVEVKDTADTTLEVHVAKVENGVASLEVTVLRVKMKAPEEKASWDSANKDVKPGQFAEVAELVGKTAVVQLDARGALVSQQLPGRKGTISVGAWEWPWFPSRPPLPESPARIGMTWEPYDRITDKLVKFDVTTATIEEGRNEKEEVLGELVRKKVVKDVATWVLDLATGATQDEVRERIERIQVAGSPDPQIESRVTRRVRIAPPPERLHRDQPLVGKPK
jgi:hypothetical protein